MQHVIYPPRNPRQFLHPFKQALALFSFGFTLPHTCTAKHLQHLPYSDLFSQEAPELRESSRKFLHYLLLRPHRPRIAAMRSMPANTCEGLRAMSSYGNNWLIVPTIRLEEMFQVSILWKSWLRGPNWAVISAGRPGMRERLLIVILRKS
jgi:hypothetical protein